MNKSKLIILIFVILILGIIIYLLFTEEKQQPLDLNSVKKEVLNEIAKVKEYEKYTRDWVQDEFGTEVANEIAYLNPPETQTTVSSEDLKLQPIKYFITGLLTNDIEIFMSSFHPETISKDIFSSENNNKIEVVNSMMDQITRNNLLKDISYQMDSGILNTPSNEIILYFVYEDSIEVKINLETANLQDNHGDGHIHDFFVITTSVNEIIKQISKAIQ